MASYIGKVQIGTEEPLLIGSTLYGFCDSLANAQIKDITASTQGSNNIITGNYVNTNYDELIRGSTIHIKFLRGNTATQNVQLQVGLTNAVNVIGNFTCPANSVISFTLDESQPPNWIVNDNVDNNTTYTFAEGTTDGTISVTPSGGTAQNVSVHGLGDSAYRDVITNIANNSSSTDVPTTQAVVSYVQDMTGGLSGLSGAMHFRGSVTANGVTITDGGTEMPHIEGYDYQNGNPKSNFSPEPGDVILFGQKEFVWSNSAWELLGDESSYALKSSTDTITEVASSQTVSVGSASGWNAGGQASLSINANTNTAASLTDNPVDIPYVNNVGSATTASVAAGILNITIGAPPTIAETPIRVKEVGTFTPNVPVGITFTPNTLPQLTVTPTDTSKITTNDTIVVVPNNNNP